MVKTVSLLFLFFFLASCGKSGGSGSGSKESTVSMDEISTKQAVPQAALNFDVKVKLNNFNSEQEAKVLEAAELIKKVIASEEFKDRILNYTYQGKKQFADNNGLSNAQIYKKILEAAEMLIPSKNNTMNLNLTVYHATNMVVGYTMPNVINVWMNSKYLDMNEAYEVTTNMTHEWLHKLGFNHAQTRTPERPYSVPYAIGYLMRDLAKRY